jgi:hypothetical protein
MAFHDLLTLRTATRHLDLSQTAVLADLGRAADPMSRDLPGAGKNRRPTNPVRSIPRTLVTRQRAQ